MIKFRTVPALAVALVLAGTGPALAPSPAQAATAALKPPAIRIVRVDVDGDGRRDMVTVEKVRSERYKVSVTTANGRRASVTITSTIENDFGIEPYGGAAKLDQVRGYELLLATWGGDGVGFTVLTWRNNKLVRQAAPRNRLSTYDWYVLGYPDLGVAGYRFHTVSGKRYVEQYLLMKDGSRWGGVIVTSRWTSSGWTKLKATSVKLNAKQLKKYPGGFTGVTIVAKP